MANEENKLPENQPTPIDPENPPEPIKQEEGKSVRELRDVPVESIPDEQLPEVAKAVKEDESPDVREARRATEDTLNKPIEAIEDTVNQLDVEDRSQSLESELPHPISSTTVFMGRTFPVPIYTFVFFVLGAITIIEVLISELPHGFLTAPVLLALSASKAILVVMFYMHLRDDSRIFAFALILPLLIALVASIFLLTVPITGY